MTKAILKPVSSHLPVGVIEKHCPAHTDVELWTVTPEFFCTIPDNSRQRDTEKRAKSAMKYLANPLPVHETVAAALLPGDKLIKLDGHTRAHLWGRGLLVKPSYVLMVVYRCDSVEQTRQLYSTFDSSDAVETAADECAGGARQHGIAFTSGYCKGAAFSSALAGLCPKGMERQEMVGYWKEELMALDKLDVNRKKMPHWFVSVYLVAKRMHKAPKVDDFFALINTGGGVKDAAGHDAVDALSLWYEKSRMTIGNGNSVKEARNVILGTFNAWWNNSGIRFKRPDHVRKKATCFAGFVRSNSTILLP